MNRFSFLISMNKQQRRRGMVAAGLAGLAIMVFTTAAPVEAGVIADRGTLDAILGGNQILEDFESYDVAYGDQASGMWLLDENTILNDQGPGLVEGGVSYYLRAQWNWSGDGWYGLSTKTMVARDGATIAYDTPVIAMGLDLAIFDGYSFNNGSVDVFDAAGGLIESVVIPRLVGASPTFFFGYEAPEIGSVILNRGYVMADNPADGRWHGGPVFDNHGYGVPEPLPGDANLDGVVDISDLSILGGNWRESDMEWADGDFNGDGNVDISDLSILGGNWRAESGMSFDTGLSIVGVPEPSTFAMLIAATLGLAVFFVRRKQPQEKVTMKKCLMVLVCIAALAPCAANAEIIGTWSLEDTGTYDRYVLTMTPTAGEVMNGFDIAVHDTGWDDNIFVDGTATTIFQEGKDEDTSFLLSKSHLTFPGGPPVTVDDLVIGSSGEWETFIMGAFATAGSGAYDAGWSGALELLEIIVARGAVTDPYSEFTVVDSVYGSPAICVLADDSQVGITMVPEPSTLALLASGLIGLLCYAWRKRR